MRTCSKCGETKPLTTGFHRESHGYRGVCRDCRNSQRRARHAANPEPIRERDRARQVEKNKSYYAANVERERERAAAWKRRNRERARETHAAWVERNRAKVCEYSAARRALRKGATVEGVDRMAVYERDGGCCHVCGKKRPSDDWHLDHLLPLTKGGDHSMANVAVACPSCNVRRYNNGPAQLRLVG